MFIRKGLLTTVARLVCENRKASFPSDVDEFDWTLRYDISHTIIALLHRQQDTSQVNSTLVYFASSARMADTSGETM